MDMAKKVNFFHIFRVNKDNSIEPTRTIRIGGAQFGPGVRFGRGVSFGGVDLYQYTGRDLRIEEKDGITIITGIY